jgi:ATP-binding cassette, subfamily A (ABC1), member 3
MGRYQCPDFLKDDLSMGYKFFIYILIIVAYIFTLIVNLGNIVLEKQTKMKEYLRLVGVKWYIMWITWILRSFIPYLFLSVLITIVTAIRFETDGVKRAVFMNTNPFLIFSTCFVYSLQVAFLTLLLGQIFGKPFIAKVITIIFWLVTVIDFYGNTKPGGKYLLCFIPNLGLIFSFQTILQFERSGMNILN